ncbi:MAG TPA: hypothetical protein VGX03_11890 [Candidatus Binatia bacterium]|jgi:hypothetical protein|nr:hypothetical protein [Candidatus Binatia bacterium]
MRVVVKTDTAEVILTDRLASMVHFLVTYASEIRAIPVGKVLLNFSGRAVAPEIVQHYRKLKGEEPTDKV